MLTISFHKKETLPKKLKTVLEKETTQDINDEVDGFTQTSDFLRIDCDSTPEEDLDALAHFDRREVKLGLHLGQGTFSDVYEVTRFKLKSDAPNPTAELARIHCEQATRDAVEAGSCKYAIKIPKHPERKEFFCKNKKTDSEGEPIKFQEYKRACIDLIMEGKYLAAMDHPNIIKVRGLSSGPSPFIIVDYLSDTLDKRIKQWREDHNPSTRRPSVRRSLSSARRPSVRRSFSLRGKAAAVMKPIARGASFRRCGTSEADARGSPVLSMALLAERSAYALQIAEALEYLHGNRIIVRDLKPMNIGFMKGADGKDIIKLFDFGLCRELPDPKYAEEGEDSYRMSVAGTLRYMATEIINTGCYGLKADVYSWSIVAYEMMTLLRPYANVCASPELHRRFVCRDGVRPAFPHSKSNGPWVPLAVQKTIEASWAQEASERPSMAQVCVQLKDVLQKELGSSPSISSSTLDASSTSSATCATKETQASSGHFGAASLTAMQRRSATSCSA